MATGGTNNKGQAESHGYLRRKSKQIRWFEKQLKTSKKRQNDAFAQTGKGELSLDDAERARELAAEGKRQKEVERQTRAVKRAVEGLELIDKEDEEGISLRKKVGQFLEEENQETGLEKEEKKLRLSLELENLEKAGMDDLRLMSQMVIDRQVDKERKIYLQQEYEAMKESFLSLFPREKRPEMNSIGEAVERVWQALSDKKGLVKPKVSEKFEDVNDFINKTGIYYRSVRNLYSNLEKQITNDGKKIVVGTAVLNRWRNVFGARERVLRVIGNKMGKELNKRGVMKIADLQVRINETDKGLAGFQKRGQVGFGNLVRHEEVRLAKFDELVKLVGDGNVLDLDNKKISEIFPGRPLATLLGCFAGKTMEADIVKKADQGAFDINRPDFFLGLERQFADYVADAEKITVAEFRDRLLDYLRREKVNL